MGADLITLAKQDIQSVARSTVNILDGIAQRRYIPTELVFEVYMACMNKIINEEPDTSWDFSGVKDGEDDG